MRPKKEIKDQVLKDWLSEFKNKHTKGCYLSSLRNFKTNMKIESLDAHIKNNPDAIANIKQFLITLEGKPSKTIATNVSALKSFYVDNNIPFDEREWKKLRRRGFFPKRIKAETRDKRPTKTQLKKILNYLDIKGRAMVLFLLSSGARRGETLQLRIDDLDLESDPPKAHIRSAFTKNGVGGRIVYFSYEARDAIRDWLDIKDRVTKRNGIPYSKTLVFDWSARTASYMWNNAIRKAKLDTKDRVTLRRVYHLHSLRKFFRTKIGLDLDKTHSLLGHSEYLDESYLRQNQGEIAQAYLDNMKNVSVYETPSSELEEQTASIENENQKLREEIDHLKADVDKLYEILTRAMEKITPQDSSS